MLMSPAQGSSRSLVLDVGEDRLVLTARPSLFHLDIFHPFLVDQENSVAQYNSSTQVQKIYTLFLDPVTGLCSMPIVVFGIYTRASYQAVPPATASLLRSASL